MFDDTDDIDDMGSGDMPDGLDDLELGTIPVEINKEIAGFKINLQGQIVNMDFDGTGTLEGLNGALLLNLTLTKDGENYIINGEGNFVKPPLEGVISASLTTDSNFVPDFSTLETQGQASVSKDFNGILVNLTGSMENGKLTSLVGTIEGPSGSFLINVSVVDNGETYTITGEGAFSAGPVQGTLGAQIETDSSFKIDPASLNISGDITVDRNVGGAQITMTGTVENSRFASLVGNIIGPNNMFNLSASVVDNGETYTIEGSGDFTAGPAVGTVAGSITTDSNFHPDLNSLDVGGEVTVDTNLAGNQITMTGTMEHNSLQSLIGTIEGPNGMYLLEASVVDNGEGYTITGTGDFHVGPIDGTVTGEIKTDRNFVPKLDSLNISGEADVDTETAGHHIQMHGVMQNGRLVSLEGTVVGPEDLYTITASIAENGDGYKIIGDGTIDKGIVSGEVHGEIDTDSNFSPDFDTLNFSGKVSINSETAGQKISGTAVVNNGYLESISATMEGPGGLYTLFAQGVREDGGYDLEGGAGFTMFEASAKFGPPPILIPTGVPGVFIEISMDMGFNAKADAEVIAGIKTDEHFMPDISTFEIRAATIIAHGELFLEIFGGVTINIAIASVSVGIKAKLAAIVDAWITLHGDSKGITMKGDMYGALMGALYAAIKMKLLFFSTEFEFLLVEGKVASVEKEFGPEPFTIENLIKAFAFGFDDISLPGKEHKGKAPSLETQAKKNQIQADAAADKDAEHKEAAEAEENAEDGGEDPGSASGSGSGSGSGGDKAEKKSRDTSGDDWGMADDGAGGGKRERGGSGNPDETKKEKKSDNTAQMKSIDSSNESPVQRQSKKKENSLDDIDATQLKSKDASSSNEPPVQRQSSNGLPTNVQSGVEKLSGQNMSDVNVHYNSPEPAKLNAHAYAQGNDIHVGAGQEKHVPHEAWHVAQQKQGRVQPTKQLKSKININDDSNLEREADVMGQKSLQVGNNLDAETENLQNTANNSNKVKQLVAYSNLMNQDISSSTNDMDNSMDNQEDNTIDTITNEN